MIKLPQEIVHMIKAIEDAGFQAYAVGGCVRDSILGRYPEDWDLASNASRDTLEVLFPDAAVVNRKLGVMRISAGGISADIAAYRIDGDYKDYRRPESVIFTEEIGEDLRRRDFTMNAIAVNPQRGVVDPFHGREDIERKLIRGIGDPRVRFEEDALRILRGIRFAAQLGFEIESETLLAMNDRAALLKFISPERIGEELGKTMTAPNCGNGLRLLKQTGALRYVLGEECFINAGDAEWNLFEALAGRIDQTENRLSIRLALVYRCFKKEMALNAIEALSCSNEMKRLLQNAICLKDGFDKIGSKPELKDFISRTGLAQFLFLADLSGQQCMVYMLDESPLRRRLKLLDEIQSNREPVFMGDLAVNGNDLIEAGIPEGAGIGKILRNLLEIVYQNPEKNEKKLLLEIAERIEIL